MWEKERANKTGRVLFACGPRRIHKGQSEIRTFDLGRRPRSGRAIEPQKSLLDVLMSAKDFVEPSQPDCDIYTKYIFIGHDCPRTPLTGQGAGRV